MSVIQRIGTDANSGTASAGAGNGWVAPTAGHTLLWAVCTSAAAAPTIATPAGFTERVTLAYESNTRRMAAFTKVADGSETAISSALGESNFWAACALEVDECDAVTPYRAGAIAATNSATPSSGLTDASPVALDQVFGFMGFLFNTVSEGTGYSPLIPSNQAQMYWGTSFGVRMGAEARLAVGGALEATFVLSDSHGAAAMVVVLAGGTGGGPGSGGGGGSLVTRLGDAAFWG